jgi:hypothetical protein
MLHSGKDKGGRMKYRTGTLLHTGMLNICNKIIFAAITIILTCSILASNAIADDSKEKSEKRYKGRGFSVIIDDDIKVRSKSPVKDFVVYTFNYKREELISAYSGNTPAFPVWTPLKEEPIEYKIGDLSAECYEWQSKIKEYFRECLIKLNEKPQSPMYLHYWYLRKTYHSKKRADELINSTLKLNEQ